MQNDIEIKKLDNSEVELSGEIAAQIFEQSRKTVIANLSKDLDLPGFRKGHIPEDIAVKHIGEATILNAMAERTLQNTYPEILTEHKVDAIGQPEIAITKIAAGNPLGFKIKVATMPEITLPDYKAIAKKVFSKNEKVVVEKKEIEETIAEIQKRHAAHLRANSNQATRGQAIEKMQEGEAPTPQEPRPQASGGEGQGPDPSVKAEGVGKEELPELTDIFVKTLGDFKDVTDFKAKIEENLLKEKEFRAKDKKRMGVIEQVIAGGKMDLPNILVEGELDRMLAQFTGNVEQSGGTLEDYLKYTKKTVDDLRKDWHADAEKRAKTQLILNKIALKENITAPKEKVEEETKKLLEHYPGADPLRSRGYVEMILTNDEVFAFLEKQGAK